MGIMSILDDESFFPQATDKSFVEKLHATHDKSEKYGKLRLHPNMFSVSHYAGTVEYDTAGWLDKNKDPINDNVATLFFRSSNELLAKLFEDADDDVRVVVIVHAVSFRSLLTVALIPTPWADVRQTTAAVPGM